MESLEQLSAAFGDKLRTVRLSKGIQQEKLAWIAGIDRSYVGKIERGETKITLEKAYMLARALECNIADLLPFPR
jgi:transcriptional regulator with XRE-family HTH domain